MGGGGVHGGSQHRTQECHSSLQQLLLGASLPHPLLLRSTEEKLDRFLVHSRVHVEQHGAEMIKI